MRLKILATNPTRQHLAILSLILALHVSPTQAVVFLSTNDPNHNTSPPDGTLTNSGWQWQGTWGVFLGTAIGPHHFITAKHVGGTTNEVFRLNDVDYQPVSMVDDPQTDLRIWRINRTFPSHAPLHLGSNETGKPLVVFGRGAIRGADVIVTNGASAAVQGWLWRATDGRMRWGTNVVSNIQNEGPGVGSLLYATFDARGGQDEAHLASGDSSGAVFIQENGAWKLAGINYAVDGAFNYSTTGDGFQAALFDIGGLHVGGAGDWQFVANRGVDIPSGFYATSISRRLDWINCVLSDSVCADAPVRINIVRGATGTVALEFTATAGCRYQLEQSAQPGAGLWENSGVEISGTGEVVTVLADAAAAPRFYRIRVLGAGCSGTVSTATPPQ